MGGNFTDSNQSHLALRQRAPQMPRHPDVRPGTKSPVCADSHASSLGSRLCLRFASWAQGCWQTPAPGRPRSPEGCQPASCAAR